MGMKQDHDAKMAEMREAYFAGVEDAKTLKVGDVYLGPLPLSQQKGYTSRHTRSAYIEGYLEYLGTVTTDALTGQIIELEFVG